MKLKFSKYHGTGNDFILIDNRNKKLSKKNIALFKQLCHRKFGIGADGVILLQNHPRYDFEMKYYNSDGRESSMCGNGGRCITHFAKHLGIIKTKAKFLAIDGEHHSSIDKKGIISLQMQDVSEIETPISHLPSPVYLLNTGSPHFVQFVQNVNEINVVKEGRKIRYSKQFAKAGVNVNFVEIKNKNLFVKTYERGVEDETLSCGTGVVASALSFALQISGSKFKVNVKTLGGDLQVQAEKARENKFKNIFLIGTAVKVFDGEIEI